MNFGNERHGCLHFLFTFQGIMGSESGARVKMNYNHLAFIFFLPSSLSVKFLQALSQGYIRRDRLASENTQ